MDSSKHDPLSHLEHVSQESGETENPKIVVNEAEPCGSPRGDFQPSIYY